VFALDFVWLVYIDNYLVLRENIASYLHWISSGYYRQLFGSQGEHCYVFALDFVWLLLITIWFSGRTLLRVCVEFRVVIIDNHLVLEENIASCLRWISSDYYSQLFIFPRKNCNCFELK